MSFTLDRNRREVQRQPRESVAAPRLAFWFGLLIAMAGAGLLFCNGLDAPFDDSHDGWGGATYSTAARNYQRYGPATLKFAMCTEPGAVLEHPFLYVNHPPMIAWTIGLGFLAFGEAEWVTRSVPALLSILAVILCYLLACKVGCRSRSLALLAALLAASTPAWAGYGNLADPQGAGILFAEMGALWSAERWWRRRRRRDLLACMGPYITTCARHTNIFLAYGDAT